MNKNNNYPKKENLNNIVTKIIFGYLLKKNSHS